MPSLFMAQNVIFVVLLCLTVVEKKMQLYLFLLGMRIHPPLCKVRKNVEHKVEKWSDVVHAKRSFGCSLYSIKTQNKSLTDMVIQYFQQCFGYTLRQNMDDEGVQNGLKSIMPYAYGDHSSYGNWCGYLKKSSILQTQRPSPWQGSDRQ